MRAIATPAVGNTITISPRNKQARASRRRAFGGFPSARLNYLSLLSLFTENVPQIALQVVNAEPARGGKGLGGVALVSVAFGATAIVVKVLMKLFEVWRKDEELRSSGAATRRQKSSSRWWRIARHAESLPSGMDLSWLSRLTGRGLNLCCRGNESNCFPT